MNLATTHVLKVEAQPQEPQCLDKQLRSFWELESLGVQEEEKTLYDEFTILVLLFMIVNTRYCCCGASSMSLYLITIL